MAVAELFTYSDRVRTGGDVSGYHVEAVDGGIGKVDDATYDDGTSCLVVDTGPWILGTKVMIPAGVVEHVDHEEQKVFVSRTKDEIKHAPEYDGRAPGRRRVPRRDRRLLRAGRRSESGFRRRARYSAIQAAPRKPSQTGVRIT